MIGNQITFERAQIQEGPKTFISFTYLVTEYDCDICTKINFCSSLGKKDCDQFIPKLSGEPTITRRLL